MSYTDRELLVATQIAYYDFDLDILERNNYSATLKELFKQDPSVIDKMNNTLMKARKDGSPLEISRAESAIDLYNEITSGNSKYGNWIIKSVKDDNLNSGFYGCLIETGSGSAIIGFRGSESYNSTQVQNDWINADLGLLNSTLTEQQSVAEKFMYDINKNYNYSNYATSGHSLGGNLSAHATLNAPGEMRGKITQSLNYDGPGFSQEYLAEHSDKIAKMSGIMTHYQWSLVGSLLFQVPGENYQSVRTNDMVYGKYDMGALTQKHDTSFVLFDENEKAVPGDIDNFARSISRLSTNIDSCPSWMGNALIWGISHVMTMSTTEKVIGGIALIAGLLSFAVTHPTITVIGLVSVAALAVVGWINPDFFGKTLIPFLLDTASVTIEVVRAVVNGIVDVVKEAISLVKLAGDLANRIIEGVAAKITGLINWAKSGLKSMFKGNSFNQNIQVNTYKLRLYADRLASVNRRIRNLDRRLDYLYMNVGLENIPSLIRADALTGYSWKLNQCVNYLNNTAEDFDRTEWSLRGV